MNVLLLILFSFNLISCSAWKNEIIYSYYKGHVTFCDSKFFSSECVTSPANIENVSGILQPKPKRTPDIVYEFGFRESIGVADMENQVRKLCDELQSNSLSYYELINIYKVGIKIEGKLNVWCNTQNNINNSYINPNKQEIVKDLENLQNNKNNTSTNTNDTKAIFTN